MMAHDSFDHWIVTFDEKRANQGLRLFLIFSVTFDEKRANQGLRLFLMFSYDEKIASVGKFSSNTAQAILWPCGVCAPLLQITFSAAVA